MSLPSHERGAPREEAILVLTPTGDDAPLAAAVLAEYGFRALVCPDLDALGAEIEAGAGAAIIADEALGPWGVGRLAEILGRQAPWSDLPVLVFTSAEPRSVAGTPAEDAIAPFANLVILERPVRMITLRSMLRAALRARKRQYQVRALLEHLERDVRDRDHFLATLGHELRNPLAAIVLGLQILRRFVASDTKARRALEAIERQSHHLTRLVDDLLDVSRVTSRRLKLTREPVDLPALVRRSVEEARAAVEAQGLRLEIAVEAGPIVVEGDPVRLEQILQNLLTNATKYTPAGGRVCVRVARVSDEAVITVEDTGVGISEPMLGRIFEPFTQEPGTLDRARGGLGLGLAVVRGLAELHGGAAWAESEGSGQGSRFTVTLPLAAEASGGAAPPPSKPEAAARAPLRVVLIEDNADIREGLRVLLELSGYHVAAAADGPAGVALTLEQRPDAVLVDIGLPSLDGYEVGRALRAALGDRVLLIAITGYGQPGDKERAMAAGFDAHLTKPVGIEVVEMLLREAEAKRR